MWHQPTEPVLFVASSIFERSGKNKVNGLVIPAIKARSFERRRSLSLESAFFRRTKTVSPMPREPQSKMARLYAGVLLGEK
jgi:hypothetical protein